MLRIKLFLTVASKVRIALWTGDADVYIPDARALRVNHNRTSATRSQCLTRQVKVDRVGSDIEAASIRLHQGHSYRPNTIVRQMDRDLLPDRSIEGELGVLARNPDCHWCPRRRVVYVNRAGNIGRHVIEREGRIS